jgi:hypothetical protein
MSFGIPPPLIAAAQILYAVETESQGYKLTKVCVAVPSSFCVHTYPAMCRRIAGSLHP